MLNGWYVMRVTHESITSFPCDIRSTFAPAWLFVTNTSCWASFIAIAGYKSNISKSIVTASKYKAFWINDLWVVFLKRGDNRTIDRVMWLNRRQNCDSQQTRQWLPWQPNTLDSLRPKNPSLHASHRIPVLSTLGLHGHCPVCWSQLAIPFNVPAVLHLHEVHPSRLDICRLKKRSLHLSQNFPATFSLQEHWPCNKTK